MMESTGNKNYRNNVNPMEDCEVDVELMSPPQSNGAYIAVGTTDDSHANASNCSTVPVVAEELMLYRSKCHIDDIPEVARGMTWNDPFYESIDSSSTGTTTEIIAAFDINRTLYDRPTYEIFRWFILIPMFAFAGLLPFLLIWGLVGEAFYSCLIYGVCLLYAYILVDCHRQVSMVRINRTHIAVSTRGIYIDEVDAPGSHNLMSRTRILYDEIKKCQVISTYDCFNKTMNYKVTINTVDDHEVKDEKGVGTGRFIPKYTIEGLQKQQKFVDVVIAMKERHAHCVPSPALNGEVVVETHTAYAVDGLL